MDEVVAMLAYRRFESAPRTLTLEAGNDCVRLTVPPWPVWIDRIALLCWAAFVFAQAMIWSWLAIRMQALVASLGAPTTLYWPFLVHWGLCGLQLMVIITLLLDHFLFCRIPRQIEMTSTHLSYSRRGFFGVRFRRYGNSVVSGVSVRDDKNLIGRVSRRVLIIRLGCWRQIRVAFPRASMPMAAEAEAAMKKMLAATSAD
jgi:hypothetical protein